MNWIGFLFLIFGFILVVVGGFVNMYLLLIGLFSIMSSIIVFWRYFSNSMWRCDKCGYEKQLSWKENLFGMSIGYMEKELYCDKCKCKTIYKITR